MKFPWKKSLGFFGIVVAVVWSIQGVNPRHVLSIMATMDGRLGGAVLLLTTINLALRATAWKCIVGPLKRVSLGCALSSYLVGVFSNLFLPFKMGDIAQGYSLGRREDVDTVSAVSAVFVQRVFEIVSLMLIMASVAITFSFPLLFRRRTTAVGVLVVSGFAALIFAFNKREGVFIWLEKSLPGSSRIAASLRQFCDSVLDGTMAVRKFSDIMKILSLSLGSWIIQILMVQMTAHSLDICISLTEASVVLLAINLGLVLPVAPGNIGTFQLLSIIALSWFGISKSQALTFSILFQAIQGIPVIIGGGLSSLGESLRMRQRNNIPTTLQPENGSS